MTMQAIYDWIDANADECIKDLQTFVQQPSRTSACVNAQR